MKKNGRVQIRQEGAKAHPNLRDGVSSRAGEIAARQIPLARIVPGGNSCVGADVVKVVEMLPGRAPQSGVSSGIAAVSVRGVGGEGVCKC